MYLPWLRYFFGPRPTPGVGGDLEFPGGILFLVLGLAYLLAAIALPIRLYRHRHVSRAHSTAYFASLGIPALFTTLIWRVA